MSNPTSNFNWQMPTNTDLVTDLPADFEVFGQAVDTSLADLKGGTTGQILAKATNTDMDFTWITNDQGDITGITASSPLTGGGTSGAVTIGILSGTTSNLGAVQLSDSISSTSTTLAATANAVKTTYDLAASAYAPAFTNNFYAGKNKVINGAMNVWQRGITFNSAADGAYTADRFQFFKDGTATCNVTQTTFVPGAAPVAGYESQYYLTLTPASYTSGNIGIRQNIEDVRTFAGQTINISFYAKASASTSNTILYLQNFGSGGSASVNASAGTVTIGTGWSRHTVSVAIPSVSGKTIGTSSYLMIQFLRYASNATIDIWGVQVEAGSTATPFQTATGTLQGELAACQRYYYRWTTANGGSNVAYSNAVFAYAATQAFGTIQFPVTMRTTPTSVETTGTASNYRVLIGGTATTCSGVPVYDQGNPYTIMMQFPVASGLTTGQAGVAGANTSSTAFLGFSAEL